MRGAFGAALWWIARIRRCVFEVVYAAFKLAGAEGGVRSANPVKARSWSDGESEMSVRGGVGVRVVEERVERVRTGGQQGRKV